MKLNKKGFMLAEVVVVSVVIATTLVTLYVALNRLISAFDTRNTYYDIDAAYLAVEVNNILIEDGTINNLISNSVTEMNREESLNVSVFEQTIYDKINMSFTTYFSPYPKSEDKKLDFTGINPTFKDYIDYLNDNLVPNDKIEDDEKKYTYIIIGELCKKDGINDCRYYTLKVR